MPSTKIVKVDPLKPDEHFLKEAAKIIADGGLVIIPTETVYGIAVNMLNKNAVNRLYEIKKRPKDKPFSLLIGTKEKVEDYALDIPIAAYKLMDKFWPGPLTLILKSANGNTIGIRLPDNQIAVRIISQAAVPVVCPSANISGQTAPVNFSAAIKDLDGFVDFALDAGTTALQQESSVVDVTLQPPRILREGAVNKKDIEDAINKKIVLFVCTGNSCRSVMAEALLKKKLQEMNRQDVEVLSRGIILDSGLVATEMTKQLLSQAGIDVSGHRSQRIRDDILKKSDIILVMEKVQEQAVLRLSPNIKNRVFLLKEFAKISDSQLDIADPIGKPMDFYAQIFAVIKEAIEKIIDLI